MGRKRNLSPFFFFGKNLDVLRLNMVKVGLDFFLNLMYTLVTVKKGDNCYGNYLQGF